MSHAMENDGIEQAREVAERALRVINSASQDEHLNILTAYLNLEHHFGRPSTVVA
jgi:hypothetical protein